MREQLASAEKAWRVEGSSLETPSAGGFSLGRSRTLGSVSGPEPAVGAVSPAICSRRFRRFATGRGPG